MPLFIAAAALGWEAKVGLVGISPRLPALRPSLLLGVRGAGRGGYLSRRGAWRHLTVSHRSTLSSSLSEMTLLPLRLPLVPQGTLTGPRLTPKEIKVERSHLWVRG